MTDDDNSPENRDRARDPVNQGLFDLRDRVGLARFGLMNNQVWHQDPKRLVFTLARYKFVAKMLKGKASVLEVGCGDAFCSRLVQQEVGRLTVSDFDPLFLEDAEARMTPPWVCGTLVHDVLAGPLPGRFDAVYALDVMEHIPPEREADFLSHVMAPLGAQGVLIVGMPSLESQAYASPESKAGHVNCKTGEALRAALLDRFHNVFMFSMNDEVVHTGFFPMAHYLFGLAVGPKAPSGTAE
ncbi:class I SAM-dependent methyltransferase [Azospirillum isscasi]|uniref:Class I SAM-dependent methyltransferase n=1 Tax=Azospirillum isscasi TaxID=3053926 RepID=A0ABU0WMV3_9PROT|nr:class I SAM-dependent methyltransferase [Azospirillum isscasi]MDQ2105452.1 class I SAM-dependent methyltransferase [Azospirillum isscasi]